MVSFEGFTKAGEGMIIPQLAHSKAGGGLKPISMLVGSGAASVPAGIAAKESGGKQKGEGASEGASAEDLKARVNGQGSSGSVADQCNDSALAMKGEEQEGEQEGEQERGGSRPAAGADTQSGQSAQSAQSAQSVQEEDGEWEEVEVEVEEVCELQLIFKWGGDLTPAGENQAEALGVEMRDRLYPDHGGLLRLHSTYRHDLKIYTSDEGRVQMTAAAFAKG
jgi:hypothetical protein